MVASKDFSGLTSSAWALARAAAIVPMDSLALCISSSHGQEIESNRARFRAFGANAVADSLFGVLRHECLQFCLGRFVLNECIARPAIYASQFRPGIGRAHVDNSNGLDARPR